MKRLLSLLFFLIVTLFGVALAMRNSERVHFDYYHGSLDISLSLLLALTLLVGALLGIAASLSVVIQSRIELARVRRKAAVTEKEVMNLRALPLRDHD